MKAKFDSWSCDAHALLTGSAFLSDGFVFHLDDEVWKALVESNTLYRRYNTGVTTTPLWFFFCYYLTTAH